MFPMFNARGNEVTTTKPATPLPFSMNWYSVSKVGEKTIRCFLRALDADDLRRSGYRVI